ncbi:hypothetical protein HAX54_017146, partial [Datura stramonium]|nr:hypothetical protein [Datura stramonium]
RRYIEQEVKGFVYEQGFIMKDIEKKASDISVATINKVLGLPNPPKSELKTRNVDGLQIVEEWRYFTTKSGASLPFPSLITTLYMRERVSKELGDEIIVCNVPFSPLMVKGELGQCKKKRKVDSDEEDNER